MVDQGGAILILCEDGNVPEDSLQYSLELAERVDGELMVLLLTGSGDADGASLASRIEERLLKLGKKDMRISMVIRSGDRASEFLKYLAISRAPSVIVWGISGLEPDRRKLGRAGHWFAKVAADCRWPVISPVKRVQMGKE